MENSFQTSFIPKKPITSNINVDKEPKSLFFFTAIFLLIVSIVASAGLFVYKIYLTKQKDSSALSLLTARDSFDQGAIEELDLFNKRVSTSKILLNNHVALSPMFNLLGELTIPSIQYTKFDQQTNSKGSFVTISGVARDYRSIALQAEMFNSTKGRSFENVVFSNLTQDKNNNISFDLEFNISPSLLSYEQSSPLSQVQSSDNSLVTPNQALPNNSITQ